LKPRRHAAGKSETPLEIRKKRPLACRQEAPLEDFDESILDSTYLKTRSLFVESIQII